MGLAESLEFTKPEMSGVQRDTAQAIAEEARRMNALVNNLLDMARIESGDVKLRREWQSVEEVVGGALKAIQPALANKRIEIALPPDLPLVEFDATLIERVLYNLLENAGKYTPAGAVIRIAAEVSGDQLLVSVSDNGPGVPPAQREAIFDKFTRGSRESAMPGVGLGLAISRAIVEAHRGKIWSRTAPGPARGYLMPLGTPRNGATPDEPANAQDMKALP